LRKQAKQLLRLRLSQDADALRRFGESHPRPPEFPILRDAQLVLAREYGFRSWVELKTHAEDTALVSNDLAAKADLFADLACLTYSSNESLGRRRRAERLLEQSPGITGASIYASAAVGDGESARRLLDADPARATERGGPRDWDALLYLCYSRVAPARPGWDPLSVARLLLERGADPNTHFLHCEVSHYTALTGAMGGGEAGLILEPPHPQSHALAKLLLDAGADPNDGQGLYQTHFYPNNEWLELLIAYGLKASHQTNWGHPTGIFNYLLGAAVRQGFTERVALLLTHGASADGCNHYSQRTHYESALLEGHLEIAELLLKHGAKKVALSPTNWSPLVRAATRRRSGVCWPIIRRAETM
jgi:hypothetical protein